MDLPDWWRHVSAKRDTVREQKVWGRKAEPGKEVEDDRLGYYFRSRGLERPVRGGVHI